MHAIPTEFGVKCRLRAAHMLGMIWLFFSALALSGIEQALRDWAWLGSTVTTFSGTSFTFAPL